MVTSIRECTVILVEAFMSASPEKDSTLWSVTAFRRNTQKGSRAQAKQCKRGVLRNFVYTTFFRYLVHLITTELFSSPLGHRTRQSLAISSFCVQQVVPRLMWVLPHLLGHKQFGTFIITRLTCCGGLSLETVIVTVGSVNWRVYSRSVLLSLFL